MKRGVLLLGAGLLCAGAACARPAVFDFESFSGVPTYTAPGSNIDLMDSDAGVSMDLFRSAGESFDVMKTDGVFFPASWGGKVLSPFYNGAANDCFVANFTGAGATGAAIQYGDFGEDSGKAHFQVWSGANGTGTLLFDGNQFWDGDISVGPPGSFSYSGATAIGSVTFWGEQGDYPNSLYWDNLVLDTAGVVPLPGAAGLGLAGLAAIGARRRR